jgi:hypothetical protein
LKNQGFFKEESLTFAKWTKINVQNPKTISNLGKIFANFDEFCMVWCVLTCIG